MKASATLVAALVVALFPVAAPPGIATAVASNLACGSIGPSGLVHDHTRISCRAEQTAQETKRCRRGVLRIRTVGVSCATAERLTVQCGRTNQEPRGWAYRSIIPPARHEQLIDRRGRRITWSSGPFWADCPPIGRRCWRRYLGVVEGMVTLYAVRTRCTTAGAAHQLWRTASQKDRPGAGWQCETEGTPHTDLISSVRCERGLSVAYWLYA